MQIADSQVNALLTLLGDEDVNIRKIARQKLAESGDCVIPMLRRIAGSVADGRLRIEAQILLEQRRLRRLTSDFNILNRAKELDLEKACFTLAQVEYSELDIALYVQKIDTLADEVDKKIFRLTNTVDRIEKTSHYLFREKGFRGNTKAYYDPQNSYINRVLERQLGIPISLSAIFMFIAQRLNLPVQGVGFPGHFLLKYGSKSNPFFIDTFNNGQILGRSDCEVFLHKMGHRFHEFYLYTATSRDILSRMIRNLVVIYLENGQPAKIDTLETIFNDFIME